MSCVVVCICVCRCVCVFELRCVLVGWVLARTTHRLQSPTPRTQVRAIRSTMQYPSRRQSERPRPMEHRDEAVRQSRRSGEARASVDAWAVRPRCRRAVAIPPMPVAIDTDRGTVVSCVREIDHTCGGGQGRRRGVSQLVLDARWHRPHTCAMNVSRHVR